VDISQLPSRLDEDSIRVDGIGGNGGSTVISDVIYHPPSSNDSDTKHQKAVKELQKQKAELQRKLAVFERQAYILETYGKSLKGEDTDGPKLEEFLEIYATRQTSINTGSTDLKEKIATIDEEIRVERLKWNADNEGKRRAVRITVVIAAEQDGAAEICLTYCECLNPAPFLPPLSHCWKSGLLNKALCSGPECILDTSLRPSCCDWIY
jgi:chaperonin cofactor prefoldin